VLAGSVVVIVAFAVWEARSPVRLLDLTGVRRRPLFATLGVSLLSGAALMVTLWAVELIAQTLLGEDAVGGALVLAWFLLALTVSAVLGGLLVRRAGERWIAVAGMAVATAGYLMIAGWPVDPSAAHYGPLPRMAVDLVVAGLGLGLVIAPVSSSVLRVVPTAQHGVASAAVVVARMMGMLLGLAGLSAWGFHRFQSLTRDLAMPLPFGIPKDEARRQMTTYLAAVNDALHTEYREIFLLVAVLCALGTLTALLLGARPSPAAAADLAPSHTREPSTTRG
jgi:MFS family permease